MLDLFAQDNNSNVGTHTINDEAVWRYDLEHIIRQYLAAQGGFRSGFLTAPEVLASHENSAQDIVKRSIGIFERLHRYHHIVNIHQGKNLETLPHDFDVIIVEGYVAE